MSHIRVHHVTCEKDTSHADRANQRHVAYECVMLNIWIRHVTYMKESRHLWQRHVTRGSASCHTYECVMSHIWVRHVPHMSASCHTCERVMPCVTKTCHMATSCRTLRTDRRHDTYYSDTLHISMRHVARTNASCQSCERVMPRVKKTKTCHVTCRSSSCHVLRSDQRHVTHMNASCHTYECIMSHIWMHHVTHAKESCPSVKKTCHTRIMTHSHVKQLIYSNVTRQIRSFVFICVTWRIDTSRMGWLQLVGSLKL